MEPTPLRRPLPASEDRSTLLVVTGILLLVGSGLAGVAALLAVTATLAAFGGGHADRGAFGMLLLATVLPALFGWLGVGLVQLRRWARPVGLVLGGAWLFGGLHLILFSGLLTFGALDGLAVNLFGVCLFFGVLVPLALVVLLARGDVARTLEARDVARRRFSDGIPLTALALAFTTAVAGLWFFARALVGSELPLPSGSAPWRVNAATVGHLLLAAIAFVAASGIARAMRTTVWISLLVTVGYAGLCLDRAAATHLDGRFFYLAGLMAVTVGLHVAALVRIRARAVFV